jgi:hypothetical protein
MEQTDSCSYFTMLVRKFKCGTFDLVGHYTVQSYLDAMAVKARSMPESWLRTPTLLEPWHLRLLLDAIEELKDRGLTVPRVIRTFFSH